MIAALLLLFFQGGATDANYSRIQFGMTRAEVAKIVQHKPVANVTDLDRVSTADTIASITIRQEGVLWRSGKLKLWVTFDKDGRVTGKMLESEPDDPVSELIRNWLRAKKRGS